MARLNDEQIEAVLRESNHYIEDGGFTHRIMASLPPPRRELRPWVLLGAAALGSFVSFVAFPGADLFLDAVTALAQYRFATPLPVVPLALLGFIAIGTAAFVASEA